MMFNTAGRRWRTKGKDSGSHVRKRQREDLENFRGRLLYNLMSNIVVNYDRVKTVALPGD